MPRTREEINALYEKLKRTAGTRDALNRYSGEVCPMLDGMYLAVGSTPIGQSFRQYRLALRTLHLLDPSDGKNKEEIIGALTTLDSFEDFLKAETDGKQNYQRLLDKGKSMGFKKEQFDRMVNRVNTAAGLGIDLPAPQAAAAAPRWEEPPRQEPRPEEPQPEARQVPPMEEPVPEEPQPAVPQAQTRTADRWIEAWKTEAEQEKRKPGYPGAYYAKIMAARMLANSKRGSAKRLKRTELTEEQINEKARELMENELYGKFIHSLSGSGKKLAQAEAAINKGHCGGLDDMFKEFLLKQPAGKLKNEKLLDRYMPTARERIEELKRQVEVKRSRGLISCRKEAAEITVLRNMVHAERYKKSSLEKKIPTRTESTLDARTELLSESRLFTQALETAEDAEIRELVTLGHGGAMVDRLRLREKASPQRSPEVTELLNENTVGGRLKTIRRDAEELQERLAQARYDHDEDGPEVQALVQESKGLMAEYLALDMLSRDPVTKRIDPQRLEQNVPWSKLESAKKEPEKNPVVRALTAGMGPVRAGMGLGTMAECTHEEFIEAIREQYHRAKPAAQRQKEEQTIFKNAEKAIEPEDVEDEPIYRRNSIAGNRETEADRAAREQELLREDGPQLPGP